MNGSHRKHLLRWFILLPALAVLIYLVLRTYRGGNDINVYLHAAGQLLHGENIYALNPFNQYLYSPLFALLLTPLTFPPMEIARVIWALMNVAIAVRIWWLLLDFVRDLPERSRTWWTVLVCILSLGFLNHNLMLGQVTILILWLTVEGLVRTMRGQTLTGAVLLALGINFKIIPLLALVYLGMRGYFKSLFLTVLLTIVSLLLPAVFIGIAYHQELLHAWKAVIHPSGERFVFEDNDGCHSLNAVLPAYFYDFRTAERTIPAYERNIDFPRLIYPVRHDHLLLILQGMRLALLALLIGIYWRGSWLSGKIGSLFRRFTERLRTEFSGAAVAVRPNPRKSFRHLAFLCLITLLIFPHQMKYSMLYFVPAGGYLIYYYLNKIDDGASFNTTEKGLGILSAILMCILAVMGRDIIGEYLVDILDYYHFMGISNLLFVGILWYCHPGRV